MVSANGCGGTGAATVDGAIENLGLDEFVRNIVSEINEEIEGTYADYTGSLTWQTGMRRLLFAQSVELGNASYDQGKIILPAGVYTVVADGSFRGIKNLSSYLSWGITDNANPDWDDPSLHVLMDLFDSTTTLGFTIDSKFTLTSQSSFAFFGGNVGYAGLDYFRIQRVA